MGNTLTPPPSSCPTVVTKQSDTPPQTSPTSTPTPSLWRDRALALCSACHPRLGQNSPASRLAESPALLRHVCQMSRPPLILSGSWDRTARLWDLESQRCLRTFVGHSDVVRCVASSSTSVVTGSHDSTLRIWNLVSGTCERVLTAHTHWVLSVLVVREGDAVVSGSRDKTIKVWSLHTGKLKRSWVAHPYGVLSLAVTDDERTLISGGGDYVIRKWDLEGTQIGKGLVGHTAAVECLAVEGSLMASGAGAGDMTVRLWDLETESCLRTISGHEGPVRSVNLLVKCQSRPTVISTSDDGTVREWDVSTGDKLRQLVPHESKVPICAILICSGRDDDMAVCWRGSAAPDGGATVLAMAAKDKAVSLYDFERSKLGSVLAGHSDSVSSLCVRENPRLG